MTGTYLFVGMLASMFMLGASYDYCYISPLNTLCRYKVNMVFKCHEIHYGYKLKLCVDDDLWAAMHQSSSARIDSNRQSLDRCDAQQPSTPSG